MNLNNIKDFIAFVSAIGVFDLDTNISFDVDRNGEVESTNINVHLYPTDDDLDPDDVVSPSDEETDKEGCEADMLTAAMERLFNRDQKKQCCGKCNNEEAEQQGKCCDADSKCKTEIHRFPGGFCLHTVQKKQKETTPEPEIDQDKLMEEIMADLPEMFAKLRERYGD